MESVDLPTLPFELTARGPQGATWARNGATLEMEAAARTDLFVDPTAAPREASATLTRLTGTVAGPFQLRARVRVGFEAPWDAGALVLWADPAIWLKLCFEYSPAGRGSVMSVVTRGVSDDASAWDVPGESVHLRISRLQHAFALHSSTDGRTWQLVRQCSLGVPVDQPVEVGFLAQSPVGTGCRALFDDISFTTRDLADLWDGS